MVFNTDRLAGRPEVNNLYTKVGAIYATNHIICWRSISRFGALDEILILWFARDNRLPPNQNT